MKNIYLSLGSNVDNRWHNLKQAIGQLAKHFNILATSSIYESAPIGYKNQNDFLNQVIEIETNMGILFILKLCQIIEQKLGRKRVIQWGPRIIDIDILLYDNKVINLPELTIPHPEMVNRRFVLEPLYEINKNITIPTYKHSLSYYLNKVQDQRITPYTLEGVKDAV